MTGKATEIWLFTVGFPYGPGEAFLENELPVLAARFEHVRLFPLERKGDPRPLPANVSVSDVLDPFAMARPGALLRRSGDVLRLLRSLRRDAPTMGDLWRQHRTLMSRVRALLHRAVVIRGELDRHAGPVLLYAYWLHDQSTVLALLKRTHPEQKMVARAHGFDLYAERNANGWMPFRQLQMEALDRIHCISEHGMRYLRGAYPAFPGKIVLSRLGTSDHGPGPWSPVPALRIVSCSHFTRLKRVHLIAEALRHVTVPVEWTHYGWGAEREGVEAIVAQLPPHVKTELTGPVPNQQVLAHYRTRPVDLFLHMSSNEGLPVALMEAASFGIPLLACDVGGVSELVNERTGRLLDKDIDPKAVAALLNTFLQGPMHTPAFRSGVRDAWAAGFRAETNFARFCDDLQSLC